MTTASELNQQIVQLFQEHYSMLYRTAYSMLDSPQDAEDIPQTIFLRLLRNGLPPDFQHNPKGYLYRAAVNLSLDVIRTRKRQRISGELDDWDIALESSPSKGAEDVRRSLAAAIANLDSETAQMLILRHVHDYSDAEIAKLLGTSRGAVAMKLLRARARLKKALKSSLGDKS